MELASKLAVLSKSALTVSPEFDTLIRAIGECKSKGEEDSLVARLVEISKRKIKDGRNDPKGIKELLIYLLYIEMLGHDTSWAQAAAIQYCSQKSLTLKKVGARRRPSWAPPMTAVPPQPARRAACQFLRVPACA